MTELMQQLQAWADEKLYDWDNPTLDEGFKWEQMGSSDIRDFQPFEAFRFVDSWEPFVQCVLDGTIQVLRPVEHYKPSPPKTSRVEPILCLVGGVLQIIDSPYFYDEQMGAYILDLPAEVTHWQPLPKSELVARLKGGER